MDETPENRRRIMRAVRSRDTGPEMLVRHIVFGLGYRYRLNRKDLPGKPDLVFGPRRKVIFVHGCFWHGHKCPRGDRLPKTNQEYWSGKIGRNVKRDAANITALRKSGWGVQILWECELNNREALAKRIRKFLDTMR